MGHVIHVVQGRHFSTCSHQSNSNKDAPLPPPTHPHPCKLTRRSRVIEISIKLAVCLSALFTRTHLSARAPPSRSRHFPSPPLFPHPIPCPLFRLPSSPLSRLLQVDRTAVQGIAAGEREGEGEEARVRAGEVAAAADRNHAKKNSTDTEAAG